MAENSQSDSKNMLYRSDSTKNKKKTEDADNEDNDDKIHKDSISNDKSDNSEENGTKFLHIDQDTSRPEDSFDMMETGEDPFAQTTDEAMDTSEIMKKNEYMDKNQKCNADGEAMEVEVISSIPLNEDTASTESNKNLNTPDINESTNSNEQSEISKKTSDLLISDKSIPQTTQAKESVTDSKKGDDSEISPSQQENGTQLNKRQDGEICIVPDKVSKDNNESNKEKEMLPRASVISSKHISNKSSGKARQKQRKISSDESSNSDYEVEDTKSVSRPKRNAAKRAESQIKVLSAVEREVDQEETNSNDGSVEPTNNCFDRSDVQTVESKDAEPCFTCKKIGQCKINVLAYGKINTFCNDKCLTIFQDGPCGKIIESKEIVPPPTIVRDLRSEAQVIDRTEFVRKCSQCTSIVDGEDEKTLSWETMDFCSEGCLGKFQHELGSHCANCKGNVQQASLGKYCVRFGYEVKQFCCSSCLEEFKKGLKVCSFCQKDISSGGEGFLAPVGDKGTFKDFCTQGCMEKYEQMSSNQPPPPQIFPCHVCANTKLVEVEVFFDSKVNKLCSDICFSAYKFANKLKVDRCDMCKKYFDKDAVGEKFNIFYDGVPHNFCCKTCMNVYILAKRKIVPCNWCKVKKYNFDMIKRVQSSGQVLMMCSLNCLTLYQVSVNAVSSRRIKCDMCKSITQAQYHLTMSDATIRNFCTYPCVMNFQQQYSKSPITLPGGEAPPIPTGAPVPVISSVTSLANGQPVISTSTTTAFSSKGGGGKLSLMMRLSEPPVCHNKVTQTRPTMNTKSVSCRPHSATVHTQTDEDLQKPLVIPIPVPIYVPCPMAMYSLPFPVPVPFPIPVPIPMFLPTTRNSIKGIMKEIKRIQEKVPADPFEAELLMMAEMVAGDKKEVATSSDSEPDNEPATSDTRPNSDGENEFSPEAMESSNTFGDDIMQMALKMATELDEPPPVDLETQLTPATILNQSQNENSEGNTETPRRNGTTESRGVKRPTRSPQKKSGVSDTKKRKANNNSETVSQQPNVVDEPKPDANMKLKYTFGVNAWKSWVLLKNAEMEKLSSTNKKIKPFKSDILQLTADELNFSLCLFVKEVKKPIGSEYAPDTIYYLCLGIQQYLFENGRIDNIFTDSYYEPFTDALDEVAKKFTEIFNDHHYIVTRVEEEHLWESKQLGAYSPHTLLSTLIFFNTKHFNLKNVEEHLMLSFSHIMKHWKRNPNQQASVGGGKAPGSRNVLLRFYPPQALLDDPNSKKKKVYEQQENEENPLRCPVKLYEFYLTKCPESVRTRSDVFYLQPERSCVPDSPVWYSTTALSREPLEKMMNRVKMIKEINIALLTP
uniref:TRASH domain-containing protein n=1 Tax=Graphocephala atropunctata TaxID=36148 RepID=A0A1B6L1W1_9HEMI